jgi:hypothetical protein
MWQLEQWENIKFCQKLGKSPSETFNMMKQVYSEEALHRTAVFKWHQRFAQGRESLGDDECSGWPKAVRTEGKIEDVTTLVYANCSQLIDDI